MTIKELYDWAVKKGIENYIIMIADGERDSHHSEIFAEFCDVDDGMGSVTL